MLASDASVSLRTRCIAGLRHFLAGYGAVIFTERPLVGAACFIATWVFPRAALGGLVAVAVAWLLSRFFSLPENLNRAVFINALLAGLALGVFQPISWTWLVMLIMVATLAVWLTAALLPLLWKAGELPVLSLPFTLAMWLWLPVLPVVSLPAGWLPGTALIDGPAGDFLASLGWIFFSPHHLAGAMIFAAITIASRWLALLAVSGFVAGYAAIALWAPHLEVPQLGFNFVLAAMAVGGIYAAPGIGAFMLAMFAAILSAMIGLILSVLLNPLGGHPLSAPFVLAVLTVLSGARLSGRGIALSLSNPALPEEHIEAIRLRASRLGPSGSVPLALPFLGEWQIYQGFDGQHTHRGPWRHGLDFFVVVDGRSFAGDGGALTDYYAFGLPVLAPAAGEVVMVRDGVVDNAPGEVNTRENWGNYVLIRIVGGAYVLVAHLKQNSVAVALGAWVNPGDTLGACGNSGRSPQPHLHLHVQNTQAMGSATRPFHVTNLLLRDDAGDAWALAHLPVQGDRVCPAFAEPSLLRALALPVGRRLHFLVRTGADSWREWEAEVRISLAGQSRLVAKSGASAAFSCTGTALIFYDRSGPADRWLDLLLLAAGMTPMANARRWRDTPSARLFPANAALRLWLWLTRPLGAFLASSYRRVWHEKTAVWQQTAHHDLVLAPRWHTRLTTVALIAADGGIVRVMGKMGQGQSEMRLAFVGQNADEGIPAWKNAVPDRDDFEDLLNEATLT